jgi:hypothetical protein
MPSSPRSIASLKEPLALSPNRSDASTRRPNSLQLHLIANKILGDRAPRVSEIDRATATWLSSSSCSACRQNVCPMPVLFTERSSEHLWCCAISCLSRLVLEYLSPLFLKKKLNICYLWLYWSSGNFSAILFFLEFCNFTIFSSSALLTLGDTIHAIYTFPFFFTDM